MSAAPRSAVARTAEETAAETGTADRGQNAAGCEMTGGRAAIAFGPLADSLGFHLRLAQIAAFEEFFAAFAEDGLQPGSFSVLITIGENPGIRQGVLANALRIKRSHMAKIVQGFGEAGLIERRVPPDDRRAVELTLTQAGHRLVETKMPKFLQHERASASRLTEDERRTLFALLRKLHGL